MHFLCLFYLSKLNFKNTEKSRENKIFFKFKEILPLLAKAIYGIYVSIINIIFMSAIFVPTKVERKTKTAHTWTTSVPSMIFL